MAFEPAPVMRHNHDIIVNIGRRRILMFWRVPKLYELECGMEINMYSPDGGDEDGVLF